MVSNREACLDLSDRNEIASNIDGLFGNGECSSLSVILREGVCENMEDVSACVGG